MLHGIWIFRISVWERKDKPTITWYFASLFNSPTRIKKLQKSFYAHLLLGPSRGAQVPNPGQKGEEEKEEEET